MNRLKWEIDGWIVQLSYGYMLFISVGIDNNLPAHNNKKLKIHFKKIVTSYMLVSYICVQKKWAVLSIWKKQKSCSGKANFGYYALHHGSRGGGICIIWSRDIDRLKHGSTNHFSWVKLCLVIVIWLKS